MERRGSSPGRRRTKRTRKCGAKSRSGCGKCKSRRVKCDEIRPACKNCERFGTTCPGYQQQLRWSTKFEHHQNTQKIEASTQPTDEAIFISPGNGVSQHAQSSNMNASPAFVETSTCCCNRNNNNQTLLEDSSLLLPLENQLLALGWSTEDITGLSTDTGPFGNIAWSTTESRMSDAPRSPCPPTPMSSDIISSPTHMPTILIEYWFRRICPMRSTFDSEVNYNRQVAWSNWTSSEAVFTIMQAMSAACLMDSMPELKSILPTLRLQALAAISSGLTRVEESFIPGVTVDLVFAVLSFGTSMHWYSHESLSGPECSWLDIARRLLSIWKPRLRATDALLHAYFSQALTYWEMLLAPLGQGSFPTMIRWKRQQLRTCLDNSLNLSYSYDNTTTYELRPGEAVVGTLGTRPNSWCGISSEVIHVYGQVLALCRSVSMRTGHAEISIVAKASDTLCDFSIARELQKELLAMDFETYVLLEEAHGYLVQTHDQNTPVSHLLQTAEAFRQAALLQLYLTFNELPLSQELHENNLSAGMLPERITGSNCEQIRERGLLRLSLRLANALQKIPAESGCRSMHPMLYLAVAVCLWYSTTLEQEFHPITAFVEPSTNIGSKMRRPSQNAESLICPPLDNVSGLTLENRQYTISQVSLYRTEITKARDLVEVRLNTLQHMLPHPSSGRVLQVVKAVWSTYDRPGLSDSSMCWFKILREDGLGGLLWS
ncbi:hypothetical protein T440DRAFT_213024 [Plenodomus tracheiphilus IPT5]|uniref:Zn(2)-C6 fungal-type domain-containing protein n=1 Tax=Plenodomus tracheiphilus IPT5 TaxID=1408161 RepID=A0A6A7AW66_9PLEO|nr:hypothetical protein T440DRAFT_213024 [Plenodomus tracheiphilus IPT5]